MPFKIEGWKKWHRIFQLSSDRLWHIQYNNSCIMQCFLKKVRFSFNPVMAMVMWASLSNSFKVYQTYKFSTLLHIGNIFKKMPFIHTVGWSVFRVLSLLSLYCTSQSHVSGNVVSLSGYLTQPLLLISSISSSIRLAGRQAAHVFCTIITDVLYHHGCNTADTTVMKQTVLKDFPR